ncbi:MAG: membrane-bound lytic murein transglycosylase MltF, partial [Gammaproteobacteria bacterium]|nr:membrane-bound lytic murein transglycosylase MltF [Gammaproteobacteria bacterium]
VQQGSVAATTVRGARDALDDPNDAGAIAELQAWSTEDLIAGVHEATLRFAVVDGHELAQVRALYPSAKVAFTVGEPRALAWAFPAAQDDSLRNLVNAWFTRITTSGRFTTIWDRYFGHKQSFDYVDARTLLRHYDNRLPKYRQYFEGAAKAYGFDWRLLAALSYQESHWDEGAQSPTGVRGLMMLTRNTARALKVDRNDPAQSIVGGAAYLERMTGKIPERIAEPDRTWMSLAAYNVGYGHLEDARVLAARAGLNPDRWLDVASQLPLLSQKKWYSTVKHGYARGREPVRYVNNIRRYYDVLIWLDGGERPATMPSLGRELTDSLAL